MYESKLQKIIEAYKHMSEYPTRFHDTIHIKNIIWNDEDLEDNPELEDISNEDMEVEYTAEYEGDHRNRTEEIENQFREFYGCVPYDYDEEILNVEVVESTDKNDVETGDGQIHVFDGGEDYPYVERYVALMPDGVAFFIAHGGGVGTYGDEMWDYTFKNEMEQVFDDREEVDVFNPIVKRGLNLIVSKYYEDDDPELAEKIRNMIR